MSYFLKFFQLFDLLVTKKQNKNAYDPVHSDHKHSYLYVFSSYAARLLVLFLSFFRVY
ncbi:hypothetical protein BACI348_41332 [Bacillus altitudinis]|uniref:Uncharacterized protein n=1 Tax=Bacillus altitudinis TaxID=293387 RepID=A0A653SMG6_BACAB|nr:hypothetical protein BACI9J_140418 [Bacillus altitudinis]VXB69536.1 hypothetical protein BACI348_41332 [Bacillus altitudinis]